MFCTQIPIVQPLIRQFTRTQTLHLYLCKAAKGLFRRVEFVSSYAVDMEQLEERGWVVKTAFESRKGSNKNILMFVDGL
jgi:hypothetical protein